MSQEYPSYGDGMMDLPNLYTTGGNQSSSETSEEGRDRDFDNVDLLGPYESEILVPTSELRDFVKTPKLLTREGRQQLQSLRSNPRRAACLEENPETPISSEQNSQSYHLDNEESYLNLNAG